MVPRVAMLTAAASLSLLCGHRASAEPPPITALITTTRPTAAESRQIRDYAEYWAAELEQAKPDEVRSIRRALIDPVSRGGITEAFRDQYSVALVPALERVLHADDPHTGVNALIIIAQLGTQDALQALVDRCSVEDEPQFHLRRAAARSCEHLLQRAAEDGGGRLVPKRIEQASRSLLAAVRVEPDPGIARCQLAAIFAAGQLMKTDNDRAEVRKDLIEALETMATRAAAMPMDQDPVALLSAVYPILVDLRTAFINADADAQKRFGRELAPCLRKILDVATAHWDEIKRSPQAAGDQPGKTIHLCEQFLAFVDTLVRGAKPPDTNLKDAWDRNDIARFKRDLGAWSAVLSQPPY